MSQTMRQYEVKITIVTTVLVEAEDITALHAALVSAESGSAQSSALAERIASHGAWRTPEIQSRPGSKPVLRVEGREFIPVGPLLPPTLGAKR